MNSPLVTLASAIGLALLAGTLRSIKGNLIRHSTPRVHAFAINFVAFIERALWLLCVAALIATAPHPVTLVLLFMFIASIVTAGRLRYREEARSLNRWLQLSASMGTPIPLLVNGLADGCRSHLARQAKVFAARMNRGETLDDAARRSKLPLDADTLALCASANMLDVVSGTAETDSSAVKLAEQIKLPKHAANFAPAGSLVSQQLVYVVAMVLLAWLLGMLVRLSLVPQFDRMLNEFPVDHKALRAWLDGAAWLGNLITILLMVWLLAVVELRWLPGWLVRWIPWFGRQAIDRWRCEALGALARGIQVEQPALTIFEHLAKTTRVRWIRKRSKRVCQLVASGSPLPIALQGAKFISAVEQAWLLSAERNGHLGGAIEQLIANLHRRQILLWKFRVAWLVPLVTVLVGGFVLIHAVYVFHVLAGFITGSA